MSTVGVVQSGQAWSSGGSHTCLHPLKTWPSQQFVSILPNDLPFYSLVFGPASVILAFDHLSENGKFEAFTDENADVLCSAAILGVGEAVRVVENRVFHADFRGKTIHIIREASLSFREQTAAPFCQSQSCIISAGEHQSMQQLDNCISISFIQLCRGSADICRFCVDLHYFFFGVDSKLKKVIIFVRLAISTIFLKQYPVTIWLEGYYTTMKLQALIPLRSFWFMQKSCFFWKEGEDYCVNFYAYYFFNYILCYILIRISLNLGRATYFPKVFCRYDG